MTRSSLVLAVVLLTQAAFATDHTVGPPGSGAAFATIQAAIDAAQPGDRVLVLPGTYNGTMFVNKAIEIIGSGSSATILQSFAILVPGQVPPPGHITAIAAGQRMRLAGISLGTLGAIGTPLPHLLLVSASPGRVELSDVVLLGAPLPGMPQPTLAGMLYVQNCAQVVATGVVTAGNVTTLPFPTPGNASLQHGLNGIVVEGSALFLGDCSVTANSTRVVSSGWSGDGGNGLVAINSGVQIGTSVIRGSQSGGQQNGVPGAGGAGLKALGTLVLVHGGTGNQIAGAPAFELNIPGVVGLGTAGAGVAIDFASSLTYASDVTFIGGAATANQPAGASILSDPGAPVVAVAQRLPTVSMTPFVPLGGALLVTFAGEPNVEHVRAVTLQTVPYQFLAGTVGVLLVDVLNAEGFHFEPLGPSGQGQVVVNVPNDPTLAGLAIVEQGAQVLPFGLSLSPPAATALGF